MNSLYRFCLDWKLVVNLPKTKVIVIGCSVMHVRNTFSFKISASPIEIVSSYDYLGVTVSSNGSIQRMVSNLKSKQNLVRIYAFLADKYRRHSLYILENTLKVLFQTASLTSFY